MSSANRAKILALGASGNCDFGVTDAAVVIFEQSGSFGSNHGGFEVGSRETADGIERSPGRLDKNLSFVFGAMHRDGYAEKTLNTAKLRQDVFGKVLEILGKLGF